jgi:hypothetical protein
MKRINTYVDFSKSFTDKNGSFYCGTTDLQKENAIKINEGADETIYFVDVHSKFSPEFIFNGGKYPAHHLLSKDEKYKKDLGVLEEQVIDPRLTKSLYDLVKDKNSGLIVPRHVFFQDYVGQKNFKPSFNMGDVEETFKIERLNPKEYLDGDLEYIVNAKHMFNGTALQATDWMGEYFDVPNNEMNILSLMRQKYGLGEGLQINLNGVVMGICMYQTGSGIVQILPKAEVNIIADASTHLFGKGFGFGTEKEANESAKSMCTQVGINYLTTEEYLGK